MGCPMSGFIGGVCRTQVTLFPDRLDDYITEENNVQVVDVFVDSLNLSDLGFKTIPADTGRPAYHPSTLLKLFIYGYLNRIQSSRRLEREAGRNVELMWLLGRLAPDFKTIADFRKNNRKGIKNTCRSFIDLCRQLNMFTDAIVAIDGSKFKAVNSKENNHTPKTYDANEDVYICPANKKLSYRFSGSENGLVIKRYFLDTATCRACSLKPQCSKGKAPRRIARWEHQDKIDRMDELMASMPDSMLIRKQTVEHPFGTIKSWMGATHFLTRRFKNVSTEMSLHVLAYNLKRMISILGQDKLMAAIAA
jgi:transposase